MIILSIIKKSFSNCIKAVKGIGKWLLLLLGSLFVMQVIGGVLNLIFSWLHFDTTHIGFWLGYVLWGVSYFICYAIAEAVGIIASDDYSQPADSKDELHGWASVVSWVLAFVEMAVAIVLAIYFYYYDNLIGASALALARAVGRFTGVGYKLGFLAVVIYGSAAVLLLSCLSLIIPLIKHLRGRRLHIFGVSGLLSVGLYTYDVMRSRAGIIFDFVGRSAGWQYHELMDYFSAWAHYNGYTLAYTIEHKYLLPIAISIVFNLILFIVIRRMSKMIDSKCLFKQYDDLVEYKEVERDFKCLTTEKRIFSQILFLTLSSATKMAFDKRKMRLYKAFCKFEPRAVAQLSNDDVARIAHADSGVKSETRIRAIIANAQAYVKIEDEFGSFEQYLKQLLCSGHDDGSNRPHVAGIMLGAKILSADLHWRGFKYIGPIAAATIIRKNAAIMGAR